MASPTYAERSSADLTDHSGVGQPAARTLAWAGAPSRAPSRNGPGSGPGMPANRAPRPTPGSSATSTTSAGPRLSGAGPLKATAVARTPERSSPAQPTPVTVHPDGSGHRHHTGVFAVPTWFA